ncbi:FAD-dependent monooxygenase [Lysinibacillus capsici]|nr:FAD-dependent monooxygenase [Lysinibacillus capsici]
MGDAAHAVTPDMGQGACQAIEDARILAEYLNKYENITQASANYNAHRKEKGNTISKQSWNIGKMAQMNNRFLISLRNKLLQLTPPVMIQKQAHHVYNFETTK